MDQIIKSRPSFRAFTLIELLIVIAIIAILAAIAIPNFLEAQTRAKVSRAMADMRSMATALEGYFVDYNAYPRGRAVGSGVHDNITPLSKRLYPLTSPIAYMTSIQPDVFPANAGSSGINQWDLDAYDYYDAASDFDEDGGGRGDPPQGTDSTRGAMWRLASAGPDLYNSFGIVPRDVQPASERIGWDYDPTNGTMSDGDIVRIGAPRS